MLRWKNWKEGLSQRIMYNFAVILGKTEKGEEIFNPGLTATIGLCVCLFC